MVDYLSNGDQRQAKVAMIEAPDSPPRDPRQIGSGSVLEGLSLVNINPAVAAELNLPTSAEGVVVTQVPRQLRRIGLRAGDILTAINGTSVTTSREVEALANDDARRWRIDGISNGRRFTYRFRI